MKRYKISYLNYWKTKPPKMETVIVEGDFYTYTITDGMKVATIYQRIENLSSNKKVMEVSNELVYTHYDPYSVELLDEEK